MNFSRISLQSTPSLSVECKEKELPYIDKNVRTGEVSRKRKASVTRTHTNQKKLSIVHYKSRCTQSFSETIIETSDGIAYHNIKQLTNMSENLHGFMRQKLFCKTQAGVYVVPFISTKGAGKIGE
ncbi:unnamed protein product [Rhizophagus irregularis]|nr:unnamed protein product [Rhizophagus irregularis]